MRVRGTVRVPGDKSISHRALILAALADGTSHVRGILGASDVAATAGVLRALGVEIPPLDDEIHVEGAGPRALCDPGIDLDCGNSGTTARLMAGVVAGAGLTVRFVGDESLSRRPMRRVAAPLEAMGARVELPPHGGLPMVVHGAPLHSVEWRSEVPSAQVKSCVLLASLVAGVEASITESVRSRDHTERMLRARGVHVEERDGTLRLAARQKIAPLDARVPGDPSSAAFFMALAALASQGEVTLPDVCVNETRTGFFRALRQMGADVTLSDQRVEGGEPVATVTVRASAGALRGIGLDPAEVPAMVDELPMLACIAARARGETVITGAAELRVKESDRIAVLVENLTALGVRAAELPDGLRVEGSDRPLHGYVHTHGDHRIAMAFAVLGAASGGGIRMDDRECVAVSYPRFWDDLAAAVDGVDLPA